MGLFDRLRRRDDNLHIVHSSLSHFKGAVFQSFSHLKQDLHVQKQWITYLSNIHHMLKNSHDKHQALTNKDLRELSRWVDHLNKNAHKQHSAIERYEKHLNKIMETYNQNFHDLYKKLEQSKTKEDDIREQIMDDVKDMLDEHKEETSKNILKLHDKIKVPVVKAEPDHRPATLTNPEQKLLNLLMGESDPVSYSHIAEKTGNSVNTVRVIMNNLKKRGLIDEHMLPNGVKLFNASNKERVKKLYNIEHM